jgi:hypothetical protein
MSLWRSVAVPPPRVYPGKNLKKIGIPLGAERFWWSFKKFKCLNVIIRVFFHHHRITFRTKSTAGISKL